MATVSKMAKGPHLRHVGLSKKVDEVHGVLAELRAESSWLCCRGEPAQARRSRGNGGGLLWLRQESEGERENEM